jgi:hypothetical protein
VGTGKVEAMTTVLAGCLAVFGTGAAAVVVALVIQRTVSAEVRRDFGAHGALVSVPLVGAFALSTVIMLAFTWLAVEQANRCVFREAGAVLDLYWYSHAIEARDGLLLRTRLRDYTTEVVRVEWPGMATSGRLNAHAWQRVNQLRYELERLDPKPGGESIRYHNALDSLDRLLDARRQRAALAEEKAPALMWFALIVTGLLVVLLAMLLGDPRPVVRIVLTVVAAATVTFVVFLVYQLDVPFGGGVRVTPTPFEEGQRSFADFDALWARRP